MNAIVYLSGGDVLQKECGIRHLQAAFVFLGFTVAYIARTDLSVAIVAMTSEDSNYAFKWDEATKSKILAALFVGYIFGQLPGGVISERYGAKNVMETAMIVICATKFLTPVCTTQWGWISLSILRFIEGVAQGALIPGMTVFLSRWIPPKERYTLRAPAFGGIPFGSMCGLLVSGLIANSPLGWQFAFYATGLLCLLWCFMWFWFTADSPSVHPKISEQERLYIQESLGSSMKAKTKGYRIPWENILTSGPFYALLVAHIGRNWGYFTLLVQTPRYMNGVVGVNLKQNAYLSALPYAVGTVMIAVYCWLAIYIQENTKMSLTAQRKLWNSVALWGPSIALFNIVLWNNNNVVFITFLLCVSVGTNTAVYSGFMGNHVDISPNFSGTLIAVTNFFGAISSLLAPTFVTFIVHEKSSVTQWNTVFIISGSIMFLANVVYVIFGSGKVQDWNEPKSTALPVVDSEDGTELGILPDSERDRQ